MNIQLLSAPDALAPAVERTKDLLFRPFRWGTFLKLCAVAVFTGGSSGNYNFSGRGPLGAHRTAHIHPAFTPLHFTPELIAIFLAVLLGALALALAIYYLVVRLRFALFECLIRQNRYLRPGWYLYREQAMRYFLLTLAVSLVFVGLLMVVALPFVFAFLRIYREIHAGGPFPLADFLAVVLPLVPVLFLAILAGVALDIVLRDLMLPHIALENASAGQAWAAVRARILHEKGAFLLYAVLRVAVPLAAAIAIVLVLVIPGVIVYGILGAMVGVVHVALANATGAAVAARVLVESLLGLVIFALTVFVVITFFGPLAVAMRNYALVFYGARYQALGAILFPPPLPPAAPASFPVPPAPAPGPA
jgi:hypothetical protein